MKWIVIHQKVAESILTYNGGFSFFLLTADFSCFLILKMACVSKVQICGIMFISKQNVTDKKTAFICRFYL